MFKLISYRCLYVTDKFHQILLRGCRGEVENVLAKQRPGQPSLFVDQPEKHKLVEDNDFLLPALIKFCSAVAEKQSKMFHPIRGQGNHL